MTDALRQRQQLLKIGTARAARAPARLDAPLDTLLPPTPAHDPEAALWLSLGALDLWERSGLLVPPAPVPARPSAPADNLRPCPARAEAVLAPLLAGLHPAALEHEWLHLLRRYGGHLPARFLPRMLDAATRQPALRAPLLPVLGERGRWLAQLQPDWAWALDAGDADDAAWETGAPDRRAAALRAWRVRDAASARAALAAAWPSETPEQRAVLLDALAVNLAPADEAFLEAALDDRRKEVRAAAQRLLAQLPGSQLVRRMLARLEPLLRLEKPWLRPERIDVTLPAAYDAAMRRDGIGAAAHPGLGEKAGWVVDMLAAIDPRTWCARFERTPAACLALAEGGEFAEALVRGWSLAALRHARDDATSWPQALTSWWIGAPETLRKAVPDTLFDLAATHFHEDAGGASGAMLDAFPDTWPQDTALVQLLHRLADKSPATWPPALTRRALQRLRVVGPGTSGAGNAWLARFLLPAYALVLDPATAAGCEDAWRTGLAPDSQARAPIDHFFDLVRLRGEMILSFQESA